MIAALYFALCYPLSQGLLLVRAPGPRRRAAARRGAGAGCGRRAALLAKGGDGMSTPADDVAVRIDGLRKSFRARRGAQRRRPGRPAQPDRQHHRPERRRQDARCCAASTCSSGPTAREIEIAGEPVFSDDRMVCRDLARLRQTVGMVFQRFNLFPHLTAVENVMLAQIKAARVPEDEAIERAVPLLRRVGLAHRAIAYPGADVRRRAAARRDRPRARAAARRCCCSTSRPRRSTRSRPARC